MKLENKKTVMLLVICIVTYLVILKFLSLKFSPFINSEFSTKKHDSLFESLLKSSETEWKNLTFVNHKKMFLDLIRYYENKYDTRYDTYFIGKWPPLKRNISSLTDMMCEFKNLPSNTFVKEEARKYKFSYYELFPEYPMFHNMKFKSCGLVGSSGGLLFSDSSAEIDSHDIVVRFNEALTEGFERHVGGKTNLRVINSWVVNTIKRGTFNDEKLFNKEETRLWFDVPYFNDNPVQWHSHSNTPLFLPTYLDRRRKNNKSEDFILNTDVIWSQYKVLQKYSSTQLPYRPPSSGFMTLILMMNYCEEVNLYGFIRTLKWSDKCYYWKNSTKKDCDLHSLHPLPTEKRIYLELNILEDEETFLKGKIKILGFKKWNCEENK